MALETEHWGCQKVEKEGNQIELLVQNIIKGFIRSVSASTRSPYKWVGSRSNALVGV